MSETRVPVKLAIVDDEKDLVDVYLRLFRMKHLDVCFVAGNGAEAVDLYRNSSVRPDIVIMDNRMPLMNGIDAMKLIMAMGHQVKFIFLSADASVRDEVTCMGAIFLKKPASLRQLMQAINSLVEQPAERRTNGGGAPGDGFSRRAAGL
jgi:two-component system chemotaxis response regulator CheY